MSNPNRKLFDNRIRNAKKVGTGLSSARRPMPGYDTNYTRSTPCVRHGKPYKNSCQSAFPCSSHLVPPQAHGTLHSPSPWYAPCERTKRTPVICKSVPTAPALFSLQIQLVFEYADCPSSHSCGMPYTWSPLGKWRLRPYPASYGTPYISNPSSNESCGCKAKVAPQCTTFPSQMPQLQISKNY